jgi:hypothetical protein
MVVFVPLVAVPVEVRPVLVVTLVESASFRLLVSSLWMVSVGHTRNPQRGLVESALRRAGGVAEFVHRKQTFVAAPTDSVGR